MLGSKSIYLYLGGALVVAVILVGGAFLAGRQPSEKLLDATAPAKVDNTSVVQPTTQNSSFKIEDLVVGKGDPAEAGKRITVYYKGTLLDGTKFDSSYDRGQPFQFTLGKGEVIRGWDEGFSGMKVGGKRKLIIPAEMGYGDQAVGVIPPNSVLVFEVELLGV
ncbi:MAG: Peptidyl-prolyl cis-trans isomerase [Candidatus Nomurabacteria bacterium GW2011_GWA1_46_11]|uniref:Peptidyl-prolyl cis-trans isomerase n=1 Tax=Candidatus Nomurabacteria bacterium GW2011_GWA1_46_11 TaxID=1618732 RepID=A0A0G1NP04_9BACT|nr:MAG: Peptidyl-prolyl cis-trans isomerase [Microgenomates group bacterium GW2011_GWA2_44_7]KKT78334.1 MAG: Peptidyl-prolyl cis-trans isomerase [Microgenomates group bacterium GW2011_GWB1_44_8]KKU22394.1 MAG: Peptidyl-prolyl cis-trans isomerase [Candidatus Nomurabacteria bacterium GW2011_GWA1_46_11]